MTVHGCMFCHVQTGLTLCPLCGDIYYCDLHESSHLAKSGESCYPWLVEVRPGVGRVAVASRDITCHQLVVEDQPVGLSPTQDSPLACLTCSSLLHSDNPGVECECGFLLCSPECSRASQHQPEHDLFVAAGRRSRGRPDFPLVMPVRLLAVMDSASRELEDRLGRLMDHREDRLSRRAEWERVDTAVVQPILRLARAGGKDWTEEQVERCIGITRINGVSCSAKIGASQDSEQGEVRMLYPGMSVFSHSCRPNSQSLHRADYGLALVATRDIQAGTELTITYCSLLGSSVARREDITNNWYFTCQCDRCSDQDRGANLDTWRCHQPDCGGLISPENTARPSFVCGACSHRVEHENILEKEKIIRHSLDEDGDCQDNYEKFISDNQTELHDDHWIITQARISILNGADFNTKDLPRIEKLSSHCRKLIQMIDTLELGNISMRGYIEYHLSVLSITSLNYNFQVGAIHKDELKHGLLETSARLKVCISCLGLEEKGTYKRLLAERGEAMLSHVTQWITFVEFI